MSKLYYYGHDRGTKVRLALRSEGNWWVAYLAHAGTMEGSHELGRIDLAIVQSAPAHKQAFMDLMSAVVAQGVERISGTRPAMQMAPAPEHEKAGRA